ncbi:MAG: indole-3-glycerol phosphate synthase [Magnetococcales bacterium]|nr:indole-3-glycerol phosphate synthase [Magnetococcales bacterium]HIJ83689.1 indole-3-glycerol phosphate synthase TrpC [Magnetococcales bacterium]
MTIRGTVLERIMATKRAEVARSRSRWSESALMDMCAERGAPRGFLQTIEKKMAAGQKAIIAEIKRASPSKGRIFPGDDHAFDPVRIGMGYQEHGAVCLSCLTDRDYFQGSDDFLSPLRRQVSLPLLRKDFLYDPYQVLQSRALGADAVLLIMAVLSLPQALELEAAAREVGLDVLVEIHDEAELAAAHDLETPLLGINNRNLKSFETSLERSLELAGRVDPDRIVVAESGINTGEDLKVLQKSGIFAFLIGTAFMRHADPGAALARMIEEP